MSAPLDQNRNVLVSKLRAEVAPAETSSPEGGAPSDALASRSSMTSGSTTCRAGCGRSARAKQIATTWCRTSSWWCIDGSRISTDRTWQVGSIKSLDARCATTVACCGSSTCSATPACRSSTPCSRPSRARSTSWRRSRSASCSTQLLDKLNEDQRAAFVLFEIEGNSGEEIAAAAGRAHQHGVGPHPQGSQEAAGTRRALRQATAARGRGA